MFLQPSTTEYSADIHQIQPTTTTTHYSQFFLHPHNTVVVVMGGL
jgi:hypothetical protein